MARNFALPTVAWLDPADRDRLVELASTTNSPVERLAGRMLSQALREYVPTGPEVQQTPTGNTGKRYSLPTAPEGRARVRGR